MERGIIIAIILWIVVCQVVLELMRIYDDQEEDK